VTPNYTTIITPLVLSEVESCRQYLREQAEPQPGGAGKFLECRPLFPFDAIASLHFCSFVILDAADGLGPSLVFEATFDGSRDDFLSEFLRAAPEGLDTVYRCCIGYPASGLATPELIKEYLIRHDVGADTFFSGNPGRTVSQVKGEGRIHDGIVSFLSARCRTGAVIPGRPSGILDIVRNDFIRGTADNGWAEQPSQLPWEMTSRKQVVIAVVAGVLLLTCCLGAIVCAAFGYGPEALYRSIVSWFEMAGQLGGHIDNRAEAVFPWIVRLIPQIEPSALHALTGMIVAWLVVRVFELVFSSLSRNVRDQFLMWRFPLQLAVVTRYALVALLVGTVMLAVVSGADRPPPSPDTPHAGVWTMLGALAAVLGQLLGIAVLFLAASHWATSLRLAVQLQPFNGVRESLRRLRLDIAQFAMVVLASVGVLLIASVMPQIAISGLAGFLRSLIYIYFLLVFLGVVGIFVAYAVGLVAMMVIGALEHRDKSRFEDSAGLIDRAGENARKYSREEGGINRFQNHLASVTCVKPGVIRYWLLRLVLLGVNLLARFWFNRGELGGIPTILSARWVMIDKGRRLLFLDNYGGAWESYLNEFIDLAAVKGLNAIWSNTFVNAAGKQYGFPPTRFLFWQGAQDARPFKAYVRQSQIETLVWYGAYPTLGVVGINANTDTRQSLFEPLEPAAVDELLQRL
jgi:hypothetical protein